VQVTFTVTLPSQRPIFGRRNWHAFAEGANLLNTVKKYIDWNSIRIYAQTFGRPQRNTLVLLHGYCEDQSIWQHLMPKLAGMRVVLIDLPGFGKSQPLPQSANLDAYAEAIATVLDTLNIQQAILIGHSLGGYVAMRFADKYSHRLYGFGLINSHPLADTPEKQAARNKTIQLIKDGGKSAFVRQLIPGLFKPDFSDKEQITALVKAAQKGPDAGIIQAAEAMRDRPDQTHVLKQAKIPVLMLLGTDDHLVSREMRDTFIHLPEIAQVEIVPHVAHMAMFEAAEFTANVLGKFVQLCHSHSKRLPKLS
jgi:pimeloyl-ACP methyl ester carboxylesterase